MPSRFPGIILLLACGLVATVAQAETPSKILFLGKEPDHPYGSHAYLHVGHVLAKCVELTPGIETTVSNGWPEGEAAAEDFKSIVVYTSPGAEFLLDSPHRDDFEKLMNSGAGLVTIHWASSIREENVERIGRSWLEHTGGTWVSNVGLTHGESVLTRLLPEHPISRGWEEYVITDEFYLNPTIGKAQPYLRVTNPQNDQEVFVGWIYERPNGGRTFSTTLGHPYTNFQREPFRKMLVNAILWTAGQDVPEQGANVAIGKDALSLPPPTEKE